MDNQKDKNFQQIKSTSSLNVSDRKNDHIGYFDTDKTFVYVYKKTEKLTTALYMVTNLFSDSEPMKWSLRRKVSDLLSFTVGYKDLLSSQYPDFIHTTKTRVFEIVSLLDVSSRSGLVSPMNFSVLKEEFSKLINTLDESPVHDSHEVYGVLPKTFFENHSTDSLNTQKNRPYSGSPQDNSVIKDRTVIRDTNPRKRNDRQNIIIQLLKKKNDLTIKDISAVIRDCSEKTIQRELIDLIGAGVLKKTGERRWSRYSLVLGGTV